MQLALVLLFFYFSALLPFACTNQNDLCFGIDCSNKGDCYSNGQNAICRCDEGYHAQGLACIEDDPGPCFGVDCSSHGICVDTEGSAVCQCNAGYQAVGLTCVENTDPCDGVSCSNHGTCVLDNGTASCLCEDGYHALGLSCVADDPTSDLTFFIDSSQNRRSISRYIYCVNHPDWNLDQNVITLGRTGGNRWTAYNWENNASNAGSDWFFHNDGYLQGGDIAGEAVHSKILASFSSGAAQLVTVPIAGYVAADKEGTNVFDSPNHLETRFKELKAEKGASFVYPPDTTDAFVYADEFVDYLNKQFPGAVSNSPNTLLFSLDNEPDLWSDTHAEIHPNKVTYAELLQKSLVYAKAIKSVAPQAQVFGFVSYGWNGFVTLQNAPDSQTHGDFIEYYLKKLKEADDNEGLRHVDVLDLHWYPEAKGDGVRITLDNNSAAVVRARVQAPRSLWDSTYTEVSWITEHSTQGPIDLLHRIQAKISQHHPGTKLAITEYNYGGYNHISGAIAQADVLGIFGRENVYAACMWELSGDHSFHRAAFRMYNNFDAMGSRFGDTSIAASTSDHERSSIYASVDETSPNRMVLVAINKSEQALNTNITVEHPIPFGKARLYQLSSASATVQQQADLVVNQNVVKHSFPAMSVSTLVLVP